VISKQLDEKGSEGEGVDIDIYVPATMADPTPTKTKKNVQMNSTTWALMHS